MTLIQKTGQEPRRQSDSKTEDAKQQADAKSNIHSEPSFDSGSVG